LKLGPSEPVIVEEHQIDALVERIEEEMQSHDVA
jgi:hypothetical protein